MNKLKDGVAGKQIVSYFEENFGTEPVAAESIGPYTLPSGVYEYLLTFADGTTSIYRVTYHHKETRVVSAEFLA